MPERGAVVVTKARREIYTIGEVALAILYGVVLGAWLMLAALSLFSDCLKE